MCERRWGKPRPDLAILIGERRAAPWVREVILCCEADRLVVPRTPPRPLPGVSSLSLGSETMQPPALAPSEMRLTMRSEMIQSALGAGAAEGAESKVVAGATVRTLTLLLAELKPLVGELALRALYVRSLHLARSSFERPSAADLESPDELLAPLHRDLVSRAPAEARGAAEALLLALANLLVSLIGEPLTDRLLHKAWGNPPLAKSSQVKPL